MSRLIKGCLEKIGKRLIGRTDMEDALKRLDMLTQNEARMATAEVLRATHTIDGRVLALDDRLASVDDRVANVDDKVAEVINGAQIISIPAWEIFNLNPSDGKEAKQAIKQTADDVDRAKRLSSPHISLSRLSD